VNSQKSLSLAFFYFLLVLGCASSVKKIYVVPIQSIPSMTTNNMEIISFSLQLNDADVGASGQQHVKACRQVDFCKLIVYDSLLFPPFFY